MHGFFDRCCDLHVICVVFFIDVERYVLYACFFLADVELSVLNALVFDGCSHLHTIYIGFLIDVEISV